MARLPRLRSPRPRGPLRRAVRRRRAPELAREEILAAAERVYVEFQPDQVGLKDIATEAGVSHALITHYFGTYAGLVEATLERRIRAVRERILERLRDTSVLQRPGELLALLFRALEDPLHLRLTRWLLASERPGATHAFALRDQGLRLVAHQVAVALDPTPSPELLSKIELAMLCSVSAAYGYAIGKYPLVTALGRQVSHELDEQVHATLTAMVQAHLRNEILALLTPR
jgi:AcrR family transcriptional regulator